MSQNNQEEHTHIPPTNQPEEKEEESKGSGGLLSSIGDPIGKGLNTVLKPVGAPLGYVTEPLGNAVGGGLTRGAIGPLMGHKEERMEVVGGENRDSYDKPEKIAGKKQTGENPLGLDQTGRWGFQDEK